MSMSVYQPLLLAVVLVVEPGQLVERPQARSAVLQDESPPSSIDPRRSRAVRRIIERASATLEAQARATRIEDLRQQVIWFAEPEQEGRAPGTDGIERAAERIEDHLLGLGLEPAFPVKISTPDGSIVLNPRSTFRQPLTYGEKVAALESRLSVALPDGSILTASDDLQVSVYSSTSQFSGPVVFAGYAIVTGGGDYLGFTGREDFKDKAVIMFSHEPMDELGRSLWSDQGWSFAAPLHRKINAVARRGAKAVLVVSPPDLDESLTGSPDPQGLTREEMPQFDIPIVHISADLASAILKAGDPEHRSLYALSKKANREGIVFDLQGVTLAVQTAVRIQPVMTDNIGGILPGQGLLADQYIVVGAHYDHLGFGLNSAMDPGSKGELHPGADDNASGTVAMMNIATRLVARYDALPDNQDARSILFMALSAEEMGLLGSRFYVEHPIVPMDDHVFMLNLDMVGRYSMDGLQIGGFESSTGLARAVEPLLLISGIHTAPIDPSALGRSDDANFRDKGVPHVSFFTGFHPEYHTPYDTADLIDAAGIEAIAAFGSDLVFDLATLPDRLEFDRDGAQGNLKENAQEEKDERVRVGLIPAARSTGQGMLIARVSEGTSAAKGGLQQGDRITAWNGVPIHEVSDWTALLEAHKPGDRVTVEYLRSGKSHTTELILQGDE